MDFSVHGLNLFGNTCGKSSALHVLQQCYISYSVESHISIDRLTLLMNYILCHGQCRL